MMDTQDQWTVDQVLALKPCYKVDRIRELFAGRQTITLADVLAMPIPDKDKVWFATHPVVLPMAIRKLWITRIVTRAVTQHALHCGVPEMECWAAAWLAVVNHTGEAMEAVIAVAFSEASLEAAYAAARAAGAEAAVEALAAAESMMSARESEETGEMEAAAWTTAAAAEAATWTAMDAAALSATAAALSEMSLEALMEAAGAAESAQQVADLREILSGLTTLTGECRA